MALKNNLTQKLREMNVSTEEEKDIVFAAAIRIERLQREFDMAVQEMKIADRNRIHFQKELEQSPIMWIAKDQAKYINELRNAIYQYVKWIVECEGISFIDELPGPENDRPSWAKLISQVWDEVEKEEGLKE